MEQNETTPIDDILSRLDSYIKNPKLATTETLTELKAEIEDLKPLIDGEEEMSQEEDMKEDMAEDTGKPSIAIMIGKMKQKGKPDKEVA